MEIKASKKKGENHIEDAVVLYYMVGKEDKKN